MESISPAQHAALLQSPAATPPPGVESNLINPPNQRAVSIFVILFLGILTSLALTIRLYTRVVLLHRMKLVDYSLLLSWASFIAYLISAWLAGSIAPLVDQWNLRNQDYITLLFYFYLAHALYGISMLFIKLSLLLNILELFTPLHQKTTLYKACHLIIWTNSTFYLLFIILQLFSCHPVSKSWDILIPHGVCLNTEVIDLVAGAINTTSDLIIFTLPQIRIWGLQMNLRKKLAVSGLFSLGLLACAASILRLIHSIWVLVSANKSYYEYFCVLWMMGEMGFGIMVGCFPLLPRFVRHVRETIFALKRRGVLDGGDVRVGGKGDVAGEQDMEILLVSVGKDRG
ncbi:uncharacterized protein BO80DRAFT_424209 [Aspergillus ibericus CBS 121593]|uniref:Rhodopsin domain-containing protein n=1 Tax=Aspergillus ibericus CBS 121593 TaxID=1448316 RepID=A0A395H1S9_9EURO|nr:hypothetical protein BO80DRAFT_424209 [Aspergillus ibericus CBS 121593]RAL01841.1 hypothetical protein BO80DRAFT_424209 [Aspergillus ibericus CBS 121593]